MWGLAALGALLALVAAACGGDGGTFRSVPIVAQDGLVLQGRLYGRGAPAVVLAHMLNSNQSAWSSFAEALAARGFLVLTFDFRGHGDSPGTKEIGIADADVAAAVRFLRDNFQQRQVFLVGASMGGTAVLKFATREEVAGVVAISAPASIRGLTVLPGIEDVDEPKLFIAAEQDEPFATDARRLFERSPEPRRLELVPGRAHGTDLLRSDQGDRVRRLIIDFLRERT